MKTFIFEQYQINDEGIKPGEGEIDYDASADYATLLSTDSKLIQDFKSAYHKGTQFLCYFYKEQDEVILKLLPVKLNSTQSGTNFTFMLIKK